MAIWWLSTACRHVMGLDEFIAAARLWGVSFVEVKTTAQEHAHVVRVREWNGKDARSIDSKTIGR